MPPWDNEKDTARLKKAVETICATREAWRDHVAAQVDIYTAAALVAAQSPLRNPAYRHIAADILGKAWGETGGAKLVDLRAFVRAFGLGIDDELLTAIRAISAQRKGGRAKKGKFKGDVEAIVKSYLSKKKHCTNLSDAQIYEKIAEEQGDISPGTVRGYIKKFVKNPVAKN